MSERKLGSGVVVVAYTVGQDGFMRACASPGMGQDNVNKKELVVGFHDKFLPVGWSQTENVGGLVEIGDRNNQIERLVEEWKQEAPFELERFAARLVQLQPTFRVLHDRPSGSYDLTVTAFMIELMTKELRDLLERGYTEEVLDPARIDFKSEKYRPRDGYLFYAISQGLLGVSMEVGNEISAIN